MRLSTYKLDDEGKALVQSYFDRLLELRKIYNEIMFHDYQGKRVNKLSRIFLDKARSLFDNDELDMNDAYTLVFSLPVQADFIKLDEESSRELSEMPKE